MALALFLAGTPSRDVLGMAVLSQTDDAQLHIAVVDAATGAPVPDVAVRVLPPPSLFTATPADAESLAKDVCLFAASPLVTTDSSGCVAVDPPMPLLLMSLAAGVGMTPQPPYVIACHGSGAGFSDEVPVFYMLTRITGRMYVVSGDITAAYLAPLSMVALTPDKPALTASVPSALIAEVDPPVQLVGDRARVRLRWTYVRMPAFTAHIPGFRLLESQEGWGRVTEDWEAEAPLDVSDRSQVLEVSAYLDGPDANIRAATLRLPLLVASSSTEKAALEKYCEARALGGDEVATAIAECRSILNDHPGLTVVWAELAQRLALAGQWEALVEAWDSAPPTGRKSTAFASARAAALEALGRRISLTESVLPIVTAPDATDEAKWLSMALALEARDYALAGEILKTLPDQPGRRVVIARMIRWMNGDRSAAASDLLYTADALLDNGEPQEALAAVERWQGTAGTRRPGIGDREQSGSLYDHIQALRLRARACLALGDVRRAREALEAWASAAQGGPAEPISEDASYQFLMGRLCEAEGNLDQALQHYARGSPNVDEHVSAFAEAAATSLREKDGPPERWTWTAFVLLAAHDFEEALSVAAKAVELEPGSAAARLAKGLALQANSRAVEAVPEFEAAVSIAPGHAYLQDELAWGRELAAAVATAPLATTEMPQPSGADTRETSAAATAPLATTEMPQPSGADTRETSAKAWVPLVAVTVVVLVLGALVAVVVAMRRRTTARGAATAGPSLAASPTTSDAPGERPAFHGGQTPQTRQRVILRCPACGVRVKVPLHHVGNQLVCPKCKRPGTFGT